MLAESRVGSSQPRSVGRAADPRIRSSMRRSSSPWTSLQSSRHGWRRSSSKRPSQASRSEWERGVCLGLGAWVEGRVRGRARTGEDGGRWGRGGKES